MLTENKKYFENIFIPFAPGDNGGAIGAALVVAQKYHKKLEKIEFPYLGKSYSNSEIKKIISQKKYKDKLIVNYISDNDNLFKVAATRISNSQVVGWFQGKMEFGPRALGNRSILADARNPEMKNIINMKIKRRESFRPFAPSVLKEYQNQWFESVYFNPYMCSVSNVKENKKKINTFNYSYRWNS